MSPLNIVPLDSIVIENVIVGIYGPPSTGKTTLALTSEDPLLLDFDESSHRAANKVGNQGIRCRSWQDVVDLDPKTDLRGFKTIIPDTLGTMLDKLALNVMREDSKMGTGGSLTQKGWGRLKTRFSNWVKSVREAGIDIVFVAHMDEDKSGEETKERLIASGGSKYEVYRIADVLGRLKIEGKKRMLRFDPSETSLGKNIGLDPVEVGHVVRAPDTMARVIAETKRILNDQKDSQVSEEHRLRDLAAHVEGFERVAQFNDLLAKMVRTNAKVADRFVLADRAKAIGYELDTSDKDKPVFVDPNAPDPATDPAQASLPTDPPAADPPAARKSPF